jgi:hypothetical protein
MEPGQEHEKCFVEGCTEPAIIARSGVHCCYNHQDEADKQAGKSQTRSSETRDQAQTARRS